MTSQEIAEQALAEAVVGPYSLAKDNKTFIQHLMKKDFSISEAAVVVIIEASKQIRLTNAVLENVHWFAMTYLVPKMYKRYLTKDKVSRAPLDSVKLNYYLDFLKAIENACESIRKSLPDCLKPKSNWLLDAYFEKYPVEAKRADVQNRDGWYPQHMLNISNGPGWYPKSPIMNLYETKFKGPLNKLAKAKSQRNLINKRKANMRKYKNHKPSLGSY